MFVCIITPWFPAPLIIDKCSDDKSHSLDFQIGLFLLSLTPEVSGVKIVCDRNQAQCVFWSHSISKCPKGLSVFVSYRFSVCFLQINNYGPDPKTIEISGKTSFDSGRLWIRPEMQNSIVRNILKSTAFCLFPLLFIKKKTFLCNPNGQNHLGCSHKSPGLQKQQFRIVSIATHVARNEIWYY